MRTGMRVGVKTTCGRWFLAVLVGATVVVATVSTPVQATKAYPFSFTRFQPDGTAITVRMIGDERIVFHETDEGFTILKGENGWWVYADPSSNGESALLATSLRVGIDGVPEGWATHVRPRVDRDSLRIPFEKVNDGSIKELFLSRGYATAKRQHRGVSDVVTKAVSPTPLNLPVLVVLVEFSDWKHTTGPGTPLPSEPDYQPIPGRPNAADTWLDLFNDKTVLGGLNHYFDEVSYGQFQWQVEFAQNGLGSGQVVNDGWYTNPETMAYWGTDKLQGSYCNSDAANEKIPNLVRWAVAAADPDVDYAKYDTNGDGEISDSELMIFVIHARPGQEYYGDDCWGDDPEHHIWSHQWIFFRKISVDGVTFSGRHSYSLNPEFEPGLDRGTVPCSVVDKWFGVGVYAHEGFHTLGAPDLYDYGYDANVAGEWDLMDGGSFNGAKAGTHPSHMGTPLKYDIALRDSTTSYGWIFDADMVDLYEDPAHHEGMYRIDALGGDSRVNVMHRIIAPNDPGEWFVLENRAPVGYYEPYLPEFGLLVWHRDVSGSRDNWPYAAAVERAGWANTPGGLNSSTAGAPMSLDDDQTVLTASSEPANALNNETPSGLLDIRCVGAETAAVPYVYGGIDGPNPDYAGSSVSDPLGDGDAFIDNGETVNLAVRAYNSSCATEPAQGVTLSMEVAAGSDIPASAVAISPASVFLGDIAVGTTLENDFTVSLACDAAGYANRSITFAYTLSGANFADIGGSFVKDTDKDYLFVDDVETDQMGSLWSGTTLRDVSTCTSAEGHGDWIWSSDRAHSGAYSYHTPEVTENVSYADPEESLVSPNIVVPSGVSLSELSFWHAADIPCTEHTRARVWLSTDDGGTWTRVDSFYKDAGDLSWEETRIGLGSLAGATQIRFKFVMYTYTCWSDCVGTEGWYIDDIRVLADEKDGCGG